MTECLRQLAARSAFDIGAAVGARWLQEEAYRRTLAREFSMLTTENALKFGPVHPERDRYDFGPSDAIVQFAEAHDMKVRGHTLVWHEQLPGWIEAGSLGDEELAEALREHIGTVVGRYRGRIAAWDVVNEAIHYDPPHGLRHTLWYDASGPGYIDRVFRWAHEADRGAKLFYNDYGAEGMNRKSDAVYQLVKGMVERGAPIHGVGLQMHVKLDDHPVPDEVASNVGRLAALGLEVHVTEADVQIHGHEGDREEALAAQAGLYRAMLDVCLASDGCTAFVTWGVADCNSWIPSHTGHPDEPLLFDADYRPKPAHAAMAGALAEHAGS